MVKRDPLHLHSFDVHSFLNVQVSGYLTDNPFFKMGISDMKTGSFYSSPPEKASARRDSFLLPLCSGSGVCLFLSKKLDTLIGINKVAWSPTCPASQCDLPVKQKPLNEKRRWTFGMNSYLLKSSPTMAQSDFVLQLVSPSVVSVSACMRTLGIPVTSTRFFLVSKMCLSAICLHLNHLS